MPRNTRKQQKRKALRADKRSRYQEHQAMHPRTQAGDDAMNELLRFVADARTRVVREPLEAQSEVQSHYLISIEQNDVTFGKGPAGTGKTYLSTAMAVEAFLNGEVNRIIITRPVIEAEGECMGFLPGEIADKFAPYFVPVREVLEERLGVGFVKKLITEGRIEIAPFAYMRGRTFRNAFVILDEAQNTTTGQMRMFLTRLGENVKVVINGDSAQQDIRAALNGLDDAYRRFRHTPGFGAIEFKADDVRRSLLVQRIVENYESDFRHLACA